ncbi:co-chaperone GroES [Streptomyces sp. MMG1121]|uniref:co-chaperone GroES n=1 Tax=Streptomyces sp. MMG1121 TaxID=1415544 RepID=UPI0006ADA6FB|nr:co-chaperone GroES [Streptomyces sp. MMG1121]KOV57420.1 molecular chaperone GroES [Streptomyces sp. MMG1121]
MPNQPLSDRIVVKAETESSSGFINPGGVAEKSRRGTVLAVGQGLTLENGETRPLAVKVGDTVIFNMGYGIKAMQLDGQEVLSISEKDIVAVEE